MLCVALGTTKRDYKVYINCKTEKSLTYFTPRLTDHLPGELFRTFDPLVFLFVFNLYFKLQIRKKI